MRVWPAVLVLVVAVIAFRWLTGRDSDAPRIGPQGRWWWVKLLVGMAVTVAFLCLLIWGYLTYLRQG